jgi:signal transduction histidine kinase
LVLPANGEAPETTVGFTLLAIRDAQAQLRGVAIQFRDLAAYERDDERARLRDRLAALGEMAAGLAHELRNPLAGMELMAGLLKRRLPEGGEEHALVLDLLAQLRVVARSLDETLEFVRPVAPAPHPIDPAQLLDLAADRACARVPFSGKIERRYAPQAPPALGDPEQLLVVLTDLVLNALEAMVECSGAAVPQLVLGIDVERRPGPQAPIRVQGPSLPAGPDERVRDRIFYPFFTTKDAGSGVGLAKAQKIVTSHGGSIELDAGLGSGATFRVRLPASGEVG